MGIWTTDAWEFRLIPEEQMTNINIVVGAYRSIRDQMAYVSMPITSGKLLYEVLERHGVRTLEELTEQDKDAVWSEIISPNISAGVALADTIAQRIDLSALAPSVFEAKEQRWGQAEYMYLWFRVIEERIAQMYMMNDWEYSNGGSQEFVRATEMRFGFISPHNGMECFPRGADLEVEYRRLKQIRIFDENGSEILIHDGVERIVRAITDLKRRGFSYDHLWESLHKLVSLGGYYYDTLTPSREMPPYNYDWRMMKNAFMELQRERERERETAV